MIVGGYALIDQMIYNRRKRRQWLKDQTLAYQKGVTDAIEAERSGKELNEEQRLILGRERVRLEEEEAAERRKKERWWFTKWLLEGLSMGDEDEADNTAEAGTASGEIRTRGDSAGNATQVLARINPTEDENQIAQSPILSAVQRQESPSQSQSQSQLPSQPSAELELPPSPGTETTPTSESSPVAQPSSPKRSWWSGK